MGNYEHRKAARKIVVVNANGKKVSNQKVAFKQTNHSFLFGCNAFNVLGYLKVPDEEIKAKLKESVDLWLDLYNFGTLPFYWGGYEKEEGSPDQESLMEAAKLLKSHNVKIKGHPLCWHTGCADWLMKYDNATILDKQLKRIDRDVTAFKGIIDMWDVINEVVIMPVFDKYDNAITRICKEMGQVPLVKAVFDEAKSMNPNATLLLNDFNVSPAYERLIEECLDAGVPITTIGIQSHQHQGYWGAEKVRDVLERFSRFGLPIHFTENTLISGHIMPAHIEDLNDYQIPEWPSTPEGEDRQCKEMEEMYRLLFEHPSVEAITNWDLVDGEWLGAPSGIVRRDNTPKPAYHMLKKLIKEEWWTTGEQVTDENGVIEISGFKGDYELQVDGKKASFILEDGDDVVTIQLA
ncbi:MAG: endo-1,4-beta-xylanase [Eubacteriales bacterium]|nr:endo-1,4-beta-xylanase [Eubacteriales bacterium]